ncbi:hypothetical protein K431DRAFT_135125 [Polychaeton citri CBS 116435]|uniref:Transcription and mRNA export factor SUS1 n=1 Tax=Polychaeton citri CBS 116435 TaxID=1314669 RepID=A0A9P4Q4T2_9PEZI|nr:hypothetical protein K431DRAFT_135125 [Polychaeton citri CBS 116435]
MAASTPKVAVNGSTSGASPSTQDAITQALLQNGGVSRIQRALRQRLDEQGWSENLRKYIIAQLRSGDSKTYSELRDKLEGIIKVEGVNGAALGNGSVDGNTENLVVSRDAAMGGVEAIKRELEKVCEMEK